MSINLSAEAARIGEVRDLRSRGALPYMERRKRLRAPVRWRITILSPGLEDAVESSTLNLSSDGFYCTTDIPFVREQRLSVVLHAPAHRPGDGEATCMLRCKATVVRTESKDGQYGVACRIEDYSCDARETVLRSLSEG